MREAINLDGFIDPAEMIQAATAVSGTGCRLLREYAIYKAQAMQARRDGRIATAITWENLCERAYSRLPEDLKW